MKPEILTMQAFGPYATITTIDFTKLNNSGIYLLTGATGSGKTMIFDAIMYALYQTGSGEYRSKEETFRNRNVPIDIKPFVRLTFSVKDKRYTIERTLRYKAKKDNKNLTDVKVYLKDENNNQIYTNLKEVNDKIIEIIGVDKNQFVQICMIAQGEFKKILNAKTQDRILIFRKLFNSEKYDELQDAILNDYLNTKRKHDDLTLALYSMLSNVELNNKEELLNKYLIYDVVEKILSDQINNDKLTIQNDSEKLKEVDKQISETDILINNALQQQKDLQKINEQNNLIKSLTIKKDENKLLLMKYQNNSDEITIIDNEINKINNDLQKYEKLNILAAKLKTSEENIKTKQIQLNKLLDDKKVNDDIINNLEKIINDHHDIKTTLLHHTQALKEALEYQKALKLLSDNENKLLLKQNEFKNKHEDYLKHKNLYDIEYNKFLCNQAGILASNLAENEACPVCGSTVHVKLAKMLDDVYNYEMLDQLKKDVENKSNECLKLSQIIASISATIDNIKNNLKEVKDQNNIDDLKKLIEKDNKCLKLYEDAYNRLPLVKANNDKIISLINDTKQILVRLDSDKLNIINSYDEIKHDLKYDDLNMAKKVLIKLENDKNNILNNIKTLEESINTINNQISSSKAIIATLQNKITTNSTNDINSLKQAKNKLNEEKNKLNENIKNTYSILDKNQKILANVKPIYQNIKENEEKLQLITKINDTINARSSNENGKVKLETYVQMKYLDEILQHSNNRLLAMTNNQYSLVRHKEVDNKQSQIGLDLDVIDHYNNKIRPVSSLSGGESFKASMALALGLSDEIQTSSKIRLDTLFIDEGFGTLDDESLEAMMNILAQLSDFHKLIGIISHVDQLKQRIDKQIIVTKDNKGNSSIKMIV